MSHVLPDPPWMLEGREVRYPVLDVFSSEGSSTP
jgi:hypothetical protein